MAPASYHIQILIPKYGQADNVKPLTPNHSLPFVIRWPNLNLNPLNPNIKIHILICYPYTFSIEVVTGKNLMKVSIRFILCDHILNSHDHSVL